MDLMSIYYLLVFVPVLIFGAILHEYAHGWMADRCGDQTARYMGRLTLNPLVHIDPVGTILVPLLLIFSHSRILFAWAKPVPINPYNFYNPQKDIAKVGLAGPTANIILAVVSAVLLRFLPVGEMGVLILDTGLQINLVLAIFNLLPVPPLDGSRILVSFLPPHLAYKFGQLDRYGWIIMIFLIFSGVITFILGMVVDPLYHFLRFQ